MEETNEITDAIDFESQVNPQDPESGERAARDSDSVLASPVAAGWIRCAHGGEAAIDVEEHSGGRTRRRPGNCVGTA